MMTFKDYALEISGTGKVRTFQLKKLKNDYPYPLPHFVDATIRANDISLNSVEGAFFSELMHSRGIEEIRFDWKTDAVHVTGVTTSACEDIVRLELLVRVLINSHFIAAQKA